MINKYSSTINSNKYLKSKKYNIILDIDETLINILYFDDYDMNYITKGPHQFDFFMLKDQKFLVFFRPGLKDYLNFVFTHFNVGFWTTGTTDYAEKCLELILTPIQRKSINLFIARDKKKRNFYDILNKQNIDLKSEYRNVKCLEYLFKNNIYKSSFKKTNTLLVDDNPIHYGINKGKNIIYVNQFNALNYCDKTLKKMLRWLSKNLVDKNNDLSKMELPFYKTINDKLDFRIYNINTLEFIEHIEKNCNKSKKKTYKKKRSKKIKKK